MRNLLIYPITLKEIEDCLETLALECERDERIGDMRPLLLTAAAKIVRRSGFVTEALAEVTR